MQRWIRDSISSLLSQLAERDDPTTRPLLGCGEDVFSRLISAGRGLDGIQSVILQSCEELEALVDLAYTRLSTSPTSSATIRWRRLHTDASILRSLANLGPETAVEAIERLDKAIIYTGAPGVGRLDLIYTLITRIQAGYLAFEPQKSQSFPPTRRPSRQKPRSPTSLNSVPSFDRLPSFLSFQKETCRHPFILRGFGSGWRALSDHPWSSAEYLRSVAGPGRVVPVEVGADYRTEDWSQRLMNWDDFLSSLPFSGSAATDQEVLYLAQHNLFMQFPALLDDITIPDYVYAEPSAPPDYPHYRPPANEDGLVLNIWLGPGGTISPAHTDPYFNCYAQVVGSKTVWLAPPSLDCYMSPFQATAAENPATNLTAESSMTNTSRVDVFEVDRSAPPEFYEYVVPQALSATLEPGDILFFPPGWWHGMRSEELSISVSMWF